MCKVIEALWPLAWGVFTAAALAQVKRGQVIAPIFAAILLMAIGLARPGKLVDRWMEASMAKMELFADQLQVLYAEPNSQIPIVLGGVGIGLVAVVCVRGYRASGKVVALLAALPLVTANPACRVDVRHKWDDVAPASTAEIHAVDRAGSIVQPSPGSAPAANRTPLIEDVHGELTALQAKRDTIRGELIAAVKERDEAVHERAKVGVDADQAQRLVLLLKRETEEFETCKTALEKEVAGLTDRRDAMRDEVALHQGAADSLTAEIMRLADAKCGIEEQLAAFTANLREAKDVLADANAEIAARDMHLAELNKQQTEADAALVAARKAEATVTAEAAKAAANLKVLRTELETKKRELAELTAQATQPGGDTTTQVDSASAPTAGNAGGENAASTAVPFDDGVVGNLAVTASPIDETFRPVDSSLRVTWTAAVLSLAPWLAALLAVGAVVFLGALVRRRLSNPKRVEVIVERDGQRSQVALVLEPGEVLALEPTGPVSKPVALAPFEVPYLAPRGRGVILHPSTARPVTVNGRPASTGIQLRAGDCIEFDGGIKIAFAGVEPANPADMLYESTPTPAIA